MSLGGATRKEGSNRRYSTLKYGEKLGTWAQCGRFLGLAVEERRAQNTYLRQATQKTIKRFSDFGGELKKNEKSPLL